MTGPWYTTRERVKRALDSHETARNDAQVDAAIAAAKDSIDGLTHRSFHPVTATRYFDWPPRQSSDSWRLWLDADQLASVSAMTAGGTTIPATDYLLEPVNSGPPYSRVEIDLASSSAWASGDTHQRAVVITGDWHYPEDPAPAGALAAAVVDTTTTTISVTDSGALGVGDLLIVDSERMVVTGKAMVDTGVDGDAMTASMADVAITASGLAGIPLVGETILVDSERMYVVDAAGTALTVKRAWDGSVLAIHGAVSLYAPRTVTVTRGALGSTAATHALAAAVYRHQVPALISTLATAEALNTLLQESSGYARVAGSGDAAREYVGRSLVALRDQVWTRYGRKARKRAI
jgi:hypothetical protein